MSSEEYQDIEDAPVLRELRVMHEKIDRLQRVCEPYPGVGLVDSLVRILAVVVCLCLWIFVALFGSMIFKKPF